MSLEIDKMLNLMRSQAQGITSLFTHLRVGIISNYDPNTYTAQVLIQPEEILTGWLPIATSWMGNGWGFYTPPNQGDTVIVHFMEGSLSVGFVGSRIFTSVDVPITTPSGVPSGEAWLVQKTGTFIKIHNDGTISMTCLDGNGNPTNLNINANVMVTGTITATSDILDNSSGPHVNTNNIRAMRSIYDTHTHGGVASGGSNTLDPNQPM